MGTDYSSFLAVRADGTIWWHVSDAVKLAAGYKPVLKNGKVALQTLDKGSTAAARALLRELDEASLPGAHPRLVASDSGRLVESDDFLSWLRTLPQTRPSQQVRFPVELAQAVADAKADAMAQTGAAVPFESLTLALEDWLDVPLERLPDALRLRVESEFPPQDWGYLTPDQRRLRALECDYEQDPATEDDRRYWWDFHVRLHELQRQVDHWKQVDTPTAVDLEVKERRLKELGRELARMEFEEGKPRPNYYPGRKTPTDTAPGGTRYVAYPAAMSQLARRLNASPEELAAWVFWGPGKGGIAAYMHANELHPPPRFHFPLGTAEHDYVQFLMGCWFSQEDLDQFTPGERYITGRALAERWSAMANLKALPFIQAKIHESRLMEFHPLTGLTRGSMPEQGNFPHLTDGLFALSQVERIEAVDFESFDAVDQHGRQEPRIAVAAQVSTPASPLNRESPPPSAGSTVRRAARKQETQALYKRWQAAYRKSKKTHPEKSDVWHSLQIAKLPEAKGRNAETIRKHMKP